MNYKKYIIYFLSFALEKIAHFIKNIHPILYNHIYGKCWTYIRHGIILFKLRNWSKPTKKYIIKRFYRLQVYKYEKLKKEIYRHNMDYIAKISEDIGIPQHVLIEKLKPEKFEWFSQRCLKINNTFIFNSPKSPKG